MLDGADCFIVGGFARYACSPHPRPLRPDDIDIYCASASAFDNARQALVRAGLTQTKDTTASLSFRDRRPWWLRPLDFTVQLVKPIKLGDITLHGSVAAVLAGSDMSVTQIAITDPATVLQHPSFADDELQRRIVLLSVPCPLMAIYRISKYMHKGYWLPASELIKVFDAWDRKTADYKFSVHEMIKQTGQKAAFAELLKNRLGLYRTPSPHVR